MQLLNCNEVLKKKDASFSFNDASFFFNTSILSSLLSAPFCKKGDLFWVKAK